MHLLCDGAAPWTEHAARCEVSLPRVTEKMPLSLPVATINNNL